MDERDVGLYRKYRAFKVDPAQDFMPGIPIRIAGVQVEAVEEDFFLLKWHDPHARTALLAYAGSCEEDFPHLAKDIRKKLRETKAKT